MEKIKGEKRKQDMSFVISKGTIIKYSVLLLLLILVKTNEIEASVPIKYIFPINPPTKISLPTEDYGEQQVENYIYNQYHQLIISKGRIIETYNHYNRYPKSDFEYSDIPEFLYESNSDKWTDQAPPNVFQAHWITDIVAQYYKQFLNINFTKIKVKVCNMDEWRAWTPSSSRINNAAIVIHNRVKKNGDLSTWAEFDVIGHELCHTYLFDHILWNNENESGAIHEGICDMFGIYFEHKYHLEKNPNAEIDWKFGNSIDPDYVRRDLKNPQYPCYSSEVANLEDEHDRGQPLGHWFYLISNGPTTEDPACITGIGIEKAMDIVKNSIETFTLEPDIHYTDFRDATLNYVINKYGLISNEANTLRWAWNKICVPYTTIFNSSTPYTLFTSINPQNIAVFDNISVEGNAYLIIKGNFKMLPGSLLTVHSGSKIKLSESVFDACNNENWSGIVIDNNGSSDNVSILSLPPTSTISDADIGIKLSGPKISCSINDMIFSNNQIGMQIENPSNDISFNAQLKFMDNLKGLVFKNSINNILISNCDFSALNIPTEKFDENVPFGILFENCIGENEINSCNFIDFKSGINAIDSKILVSNNNHFENCISGINALASGPANGSLTVNNMNYFLNCPKGIDFSGLDVNGVNIQDNLFENCSNTIYGQGSNSFSIIDNTFYGGAKNIEISASGNSMNTIDCNDINYPSEGGIGIFEENLNTSFMGNSFQNTGNYDIYIDGSVKAKIGSDNQAPLNYFSTSHTNDITITNNTDAFKYYVAPAPPANTDPDNSEPSDIPANWEEYINTEYSGPVCEIPPGNEATNFGLWVDYYCQLLREYKLHPSITLERRIKLIESDLKRVLWNYFTIMFGGDNFTKDNWIRFWNQILLSYCNSYYPLKQLYYMSLKVGDCYKADSILTIIEQSMLLPPDGSRLDSLERIDKQSFIAINKIGLRYYCDQLRIDSTWITRDSFMFNSRDIAILYQETNRLIPESAYARTLYYLATNELLVPNISGMQFRSESTKKSGWKEQHISLYPNPANDKIEIYFTYAIDGMLNVYDVLGNRVIKESLKGSLNCYINVNNLENGMYIIKVNDEYGKMINSEKLIISH